MIRPSDHLSSRPLPATSSALLPHSRALLSPLINEDSGTFESFGWMGGGAPYKLNAFNKKDEEEEGKK
jgi:hypothetical protein